MPSWLKVELSDKGDKGQEPRRSRRGAGSTAPSRRINVGLIVVVLAVIAVAAVAWIGRDQLRGLLPGETLGEDVLATVNGEHVTTQDIDLAFAIQSAIQAELGRTISEDPDAVRGFRRDLLDQEVDQRLMLAAAAAAGIQVTDAELEAELPTLGQGYGIQTEPLRARALAAGVTDAQFREWARRSLIMGRYLQTDAAKELGLEAYRDRGYTEQQLEAVGVKAGDVASTLQKTADIRFHFGGGTAARVAIEGDPAPDFTLKDLSGKPVSLGDFRGKPVLINYWATWCTPCKAEMPMIAAVYERNKDQGLVVLALDVQEKPDAVQGFLSQQQLPFGVLLDDEGQAATLYRVRGLPSSYFVDGEGVLVKARRGAIKTDAELMDLLRLAMPDAQ